MLKNQRCYFDLMPDERESNVVQLTTVIKALRYTISWQFGANLSPHNPMSKKCTFRGSPLVSVRICFPGLFWVRREVYRMQFKERTQKENIVLRINALGYECECCVNVNDIMTLLFGGKEILGEPHPAFFLITKPKRPSSTFHKSISSFQSSRKFKFLYCVYTGNP